MLEKEQKELRELSPRCRIFLEVWILEGYQVAKDRSGYSAMQISRIFKDPRSKAFMDNKFKEIASKKGWTYEQELEELKKMIKDPRIPGSARLAAQERFVDRFKDEPDSLNALASYEVFKLTKPKEAKLLQSRGEDEEDSSNEGAE